MNDEPEKSPAELTAELDFISTLSREFCHTLEGLVDPDFLSPQECYCAVVGVVTPLNLQALRSLTDHDYDRLAEGMNRYFEVTTIEPSHLRPPVDQIIRHWTD